MTTRRKVRTIIREEYWKKVQKKVGRKKLSLQKTSIRFRPFGVETKLECKGKIKMKLKAAAGGWIRSYVFVVKNTKESLLGLKEAERLGIVKVNPDGNSQTEDMDDARKLQETKKRDAPEPTEIVSDGQTQIQIDEKMKEIKRKFSEVFSDKLGKATGVEAVEVEVDDEVKPIQQKQRRIPVHYVDRFKSLVES